MKGPNPLVPQGSFEAHARGKSHVRIAVFTILVIHVVVLGALLIQGCKRDDKTAEEPALPTNDLGAVQPFTNAPPDIVTPSELSPTTNPALSNTAPPPATSETSAIPPLPPTVAPTSPIAPFPAPTEETTAATEHTIVKGDTFATLAGRYGVSVRAIQGANPGVDPTRLKIGQKIKVPARTASLSAPRNGTTAGEAGGIYTVKSGDTLSRIAKAHGSSVRELQRMNNLVTTQIRVGQKLKVPPRGPAPAPPGAAPLPSGTVPVPIPAPAQ